MVREKFIKPDKHNITLLINITLLESQRFFCKQSKLVEHISVVNG